MDKKKNIFFRDFNDMPMVKPIWLTTKIIILLFAIVMVSSCVYNCRQHQKYGGEDPARYHEIMQLAEKLPPEPISLTEIFPGHDDAYFIYLAPYAFVGLNVQCPQFSEEFIKSLNIEHTSLEHITRWAIFDENGLIESIAFFNGYSGQESFCVRLDEIYWMPGTTKFEVRCTPPWLERSWDFEITEDNAITERPLWSPPNTIKSEDFSRFLAVFSQDPQFQFKNTRWPLQVFYIDPEDEGLHIEETIYYTRPTSSSSCGGTLFPTKAELETANLEYAVSMHEASDGPQAAVVLTNADSMMLYIYVFQWHNGWYLLEISDLTN